MKRFSDQLHELEAVDWIIICLAIIAYIPLAIAIIKDKEKGAGQNFCTWVLWVILDIVQFICTVLAGGTYVMFFAFIPCASIIMCLVFRYRKKMDDFEKIIAVLVFLCIVIWLLFGEYWAIVFQTLSQIIAGLPLLRDTWRKAKEFRKTLLPLSIFAIVHLLCILRKDGWSVEHTLFPAALEIFTLVSILPIILYLIKQKRKTHL
ncbi:MAG: hypothetical protein V4665_04145 [Patescibacteria group bacterium]